MTYGNGSKISYTYDSLNRLKTRTGYGWTESYTYDRNGNIARLEARYGATTRRVIDYEYDSIGRLISSVETDENGEITRYVKNQYDTKNRLTSYTYFDGKAVRTQSYTYNKDGTVKTFTVSNGDQITNTHDSLNRITKKTIIPQEGSQYIFASNTTYKAGTAANQTTSLVESVRYSFNNNRSQELSIQI